MCEKKEMMELSSPTTPIGTGITSSKANNNNNNNNTYPPKEHQQQELKHQEIDCLTSSIASPKPNQVSTVLLYGIPIVSLYIESQERLCLAQISNTLLKQFSYNEIHNRRVALGITCVQCTPVQLEILRRAGAMPVSSRRCGMITRREAERLCKSFLGDNAPPRLPDDFAFSVHHKCAWGCRGSFLPSRYNSSRAKCIKCSYCGLFFSPNKFIFHSHRIGPGDKYVQPDAANFNSWRRHMKLSGTPPEEITHAWEDVKAMFNGGTRKRLMTTASSSITAVAVAVTAIATNSTSSSSSSSSSKAAQSPKRFKESSPGRTNSVNTPPGQIPLRPLNIHQHHGVSGGCGNSLSATNQISNLPGRSSSTDITLPFSRNFMMDYMWHAHAQNNKASNNHFHFPNYSLPWIKGSTGSFIFGNGNQNALMTPISTTAQDQTLTNSSSNLDTVSHSDASPSGSNERFGSPPHSYSSTTAAQEVDSLTGFYNTSAFKPVMQLNRSTSSYSTTSSKTLALETVAAVAAAAAVAVNSQDNEQKSLGQAPPAPGNQQHPSTTPQIKESFSSDDEMVDIETTEEEEKPFELEHQGLKLLKMDEYNEALRKPIGVDNSKDALSWKKFIEKEQPMQSHSTCRMQSPTSSLISHSPASSINSEHHVSYQPSNKSTSSTPDVILTTSPAPSSGSMSLDLQKTNIPEQQRNVAAAIVSAFSHHRHHHPNQFLPLHQQQASHLPRMPLPLSTTSIASAANGSLPISPASLVTSRLKADFNSNGSTIFGTRTHNYNSIDKNNQTFLINTNNNSLTSANNSGEAIVPPCVNNEFWSVARLSFNRPNDYNQQHRVPITTDFHRHHHDITKHFQAFRHHGHETPTQTNGVG